MVLNPEQIEQIKKQILDQIENSFPEDKKEFAKQQLNLMNGEQLEEFIIQNNLLKTEEENSNECIFCSIVSEKIHSYKINENNKALAVLELNPISRGHLLILPKEHGLEIDDEIKEFAKKISIDLKKKLNAREIHLKQSDLFGHKILNLIPIYDDKTLEGKRQPAPENILKDLQEELKIEEPKKEEKQIAKEDQKEENPVITEKDMILPKRIP